MANSGETAASHVVTGVELDSLITKVKDLFHDFGEGFILVSLQKPSLTKYKSYGAHAFFEEKPCVSYGHRLALRNTSLIQRRSSMLSLKNLSPQDWLAWIALFLGKQFGSVTLVFFFLF